MADQPSSEPQAEVLIAEFEKNSREVVRVRLTEYRGMKLLDIRTFYEDAGQWKPGKGIALRQGLLPQLVEALEAAKTLVEAGEPPAA